MREEPVEHHDVRHDQKRDIEGVDQGADAGRIGERLGAHANDLRLRPIQEADDVEDPGHRDCARHARPEQDYGNECQQRRDRVAVNNGVESKGGNISRDLPRQQSGQRDIAKDVQPSECSQAIFERELGEPGNKIPPRDEAKSDKTQQRLDADDQQGSGHRAGGTP